MSKQIFYDFPVEAINQWAEALDTGVAPTDPHAEAVKSGLIVNLNGTILAYPGNGHDPQDWAFNIARLATQGKILDGVKEPVVVEREFGTGAGERYAIESDFPGYVDGNIAPLDHIKNPCAEIALGVHTMSRESGETQPALDAMTSEEKEEHTSDAAATLLETATDTAESSPEPSPALPGNPEPAVEDVPWETEDASSGADGSSNTVTDPTPSPEPPPAQEPTPAPASPVKPKADALRARISAVPTYYAALKEPLNKLVDLGADELVIETALDLAGKPYHLGQIAAFARYITLNIDKFDAMTLIQNAHRSGIRVENTADANAKVLAEVMERIPDNAKARFKTTFEKHVAEGLDKFWAEAWAQTMAALEAGRITTPINFFLHVVNDLKKNTELADKRGGAVIKDFSEIRWIMDYLPKNEQMELPDDCGLTRSTRKYYLPKMKDAIERAGRIDPSWALSILMDNEYPTRSLSVPLAALVEKFPALSNIVTKDQFDYAMTQLAGVLIDRAARCRESWNPKFHENHGATFMHHAVFNGHQYLKNLKDYLDRGMKFMQPYKEALNTLLEDKETLELMEFWWLNHNPWTHGTTPEAARVHREEEIDYNARARAAEERRQAELRESEAQKPDLLRLAGVQGGPRTDGVFGSLPPVG